MTKPTKKPGEPSKLSAEGISPFDSTRRKRKKKRKNAAKKKSKIKTGKSTGGRPPYQPSSEDIAVAQALAEVGFTQEDMAEHFGISVHSVTKYFGANFKGALGRVLTRGYSAVAQALREKGGVGFSAGRYVLSTKGKKFGWTESMEVTGPGGVDLFAQLDLTKLGPERLQKLKELLALAGAAV